MSHSEVIEKLFAKGILVNKELLEKDLDDSLISKLDGEEDLLVLNEDYSELLRQENVLVDWYDIDHYRVLAESDRDDDLYQSHLSELQRSITTMQTPSEEFKQSQSSLETELENDTSSFDTSAQAITTVELLEVDIIFDYINKPKKYAITDFSRLFLSRYYFLERILRQRKELLSATTIHRLQGKKEREQVALIGIVHEVAETRKGSLMITLEDPTGLKRIIISKQKKELFTSAKDLVHDEVIGITGTTADEIVFGENIIWPDIPPNDLKKGPSDDHAVFISDIHVGSSYFLEDAFLKFLKWIKGEVGNEQQRALANKIKYLFIAGDLIDGIGVYPGHENELTIKTLHGQFTAVAEYLKQVPSHIQIIVCPGNHDGVHLAEPQSKFYEKHASALYELSNLTVVTNPGMVNIGKKEGFSGFDVLLYHGYSFDYFVRNVESIRFNGGYHRADLIMQFLMQRRHLAPSFRSTPYYPGHTEDPLLIKKVPDFFLSGHIHYSCVANYRGVTMICGSCWQSSTAFQEKMGHEPEPGRVPVVNLKTREIKVLKFI